LCQDISQSEFRINTRQSAGLRAGAVRDDTQRQAQNSGNNDATQQAARRRTPQSDVAPQPQKRLPALLTAVEGICGTKPTLIRKDNSYSSVSVRNAKFDLMSPIEKEAA